MAHNSVLRCALTVLLLGISQAAHATFDLQFTIDSSAAFNTTQRALLLEALGKTEALWEDVITGYQPGISVTTVPITVFSTPGIGLARGGSSTQTFQGGFVVSTSGALEVDPTTINNFAPWNGIPGPPVPPPQYLGLNYLDEILEHEVGHALGIGTLWEVNGVYVNNSYQYTGEHGVAAYKKEFDPLATFIPVEDAVLTGTQNSHWNQQMRSSGEAGDPSNPWILDPRVGIVGPNGRDFSSELMTGALDPDYGEPFLSLTTIQSLRDMGYTTVPEPGTLGMLVIATGFFLGRRLRASF